MVEDSKGNHVLLDYRSLIGGLDDLEDFYLADATMEQVRKGQEKVFDAQQVRSDLGLDH